MQYVAKYVGHVIVQSGLYTSVTSYQIDQITIAFYSVFAQVRTVRTAHTPSFSIFPAIKYRTDLD
jgi:hypothetical protein